METLKSLFATRGCQAAETQTPRAGLRFGAEVLAWWRGTYGAKDVDVARLLCALGCQVHVRPLRASSGGLQGLLVPSEDGFVVVVDPNPVPGPQAAVSAAQLRQMRMAHELAHLCFGARRLRGTSLSAEQEERFCDAFADGLLTDMGMGRGAVAALLAA